MSPDDLARRATALLQRLARVAARTSESAYLVGGDRYLFGGLSWEWLRNRGVPRVSLAREARHLADPQHGLDRFGRALEARWKARRPADRVDALLGAAALLYAALPRSFWLPIEADALLLVLSATYREMRVRAYNKASYVVPFRGPDHPRPRWQPFLNSVSIASEEQLPGRPDVLAAFWGMHELSHLVLMTSPPVDEAALPRRYVRWMLGQEGKTIAAQIRISEEVRARVPHPAVVGLFNRPSIAHGFAPVPRVARPSLSLLRAWVDLARWMSPPRVPGPRTLAALRTNEDFAVGSLIYALEHRAVYTSGARGELVRSLFPAARPASEPARGLRTEVEALVEGKSGLDPRARARIARGNASVVLRYRLAELRDFLSVLPGASKAAAGRLDRVRASLDGDPGRAAGEIRSTLKRELPVLRPFGFEESYAHLHPSLFDIRA